MTKHSIEAVHDCLLAIGEECEDNILSLNSGGCGVWAYLVARQLHKRRIAHEIITFGGCAKPIQDVVKEARRNNGLTDREVLQEAAWDEDEEYPCLRSHLGVRLLQTGRWYDSEGVHTSEGCGRWPPNPGYLPLWAARAWALEPSLWNDWYDRDQNPEVARIVRKHFKRLDAGEFAPRWTQEDEQLLNELGMQLA